MRRGYIRLSKAGPSLSEQQELLRGAGVDVEDASGPVYVDQAEDKARSQRGSAIRSLREGDELVIATASRLATTKLEALAVLEQIGRRGAALLIADSEQRVTWQPEAESAIAFAVAAEEEARHEVAAAMRRRKAEVGARSGPVPKLTGKKAERAKLIWLDSTISGAEAAAKIGISVPTLHRMFGPRGTPRFGRKATK